MRIKTIDERTPKTDAPLEKICHVYAKMPWGTYHIQEASANIVARNNWEGSKLLVINDSFNSVTLSIDAIKEIISSFEGEE